MKEKILRYRHIIVGVALGMIGGYLYYAFVGCTSGSCAITSKPLNSILYFGGLGGLMADLFSKKSSRNNTIHE